MRASLAAHTNLAALENSLRLAKWKSSGVEEELKRLTIECGKYKAYRFQLLYAEVLRRKMIHATKIQGEMGFLRQEIRYRRAKLNAAGQARTAVHAAPRTEPMWGPVNEEIPIGPTADDEPMWGPINEEIPIGPAADDEPMWGPINEEIPIGPAADDEPMWGPINEEIPIGPAADDEPMWGPLNEGGPDGPTPEHEPLWAPIVTEMSPEREETGSDEVTTAQDFAESATTHRMSNFERFKAALIELAERLRGLALPRQILPMVLASRVEIPSPAPLDEVQQNLLETAIPQLTLEIASPQLSLEAHCEPEAKTEPTAGSETRLPKTLFIDWLVVCQLVTEDDSVTDPSVDTDLPALRERIAEATNPVVETDTLRPVADPPTPVAVAAVTARKWHQYKPEPRNRGRKKQRRSKRTK